MGINAGRRREALIKYTCPMFFFFFSNQNWIYCLTFLTRNISYRKYINGALWKIFNIQVKNIP